MPYAIEKIGSYYRLRNADTGELMPAKHKTKAMAVAQARAIMASEAGNKMAEEMARRHRKR